MTRYRSARRGSGAYTLVELMIVVTIMLVLAAITLPVAKQVLNDSHVREASRQLRLVEFGQCEGEEWWCEHGHIGYVLAGSLQINFDGQVLSFAAGDGLFIPPGAATRHRGMNIAPGTRLLMVEDL